MEHLGFSASAGPVQAHNIQRRDVMLYEGGGDAEMQQCVPPSDALTGSRSVKVRMHPLRCTGVGPCSQHHAQSFSEAQRKASESSTTSSG